MKSKLQKRIGFTTIQSFCLSSVSYTHLFRDTLRSVDDKYYILFEIGIGTGLQLQDILQFKVKDVRGKDMLIAVIGTRQIEQAFPLKPELQAVITDFIDGRDDDEYLITGYASTNRPLSREQAYRIFKQTGNKIGLKSIGTQTMRCLLYTSFWKQLLETRFRRPAASPSSIWRPSNHAVPLKLRVLARILKEDVPLPEMCIRDSIFVVFIPFHL